MKRTVAAVLAVAMVMFAGAAFAGDQKGVIKSVSGRTVTLDNGQTYTFPAAAAGAADMMAGLAAGQTVTLTFTTANNVNTVSKVAK